MLKYLHWNDLLRLRRVCKWTKGITNAYLWINPKRAPEIEINEDNGKSLEAFVAMGIPSARLFLNNDISGYYFYKQIDEKTRHHFLEDYGPHVKGLRVAQITLCPFGRELDFLDGMKNLTAFEAGYFGHGRKKGGDVEWGAEESAILARAKDDPRLSNFGLPKIFTSLKAIKIGQDYSFCKNFSVIKRGGDALLTCPQLKYASLPYDSTFQTNEFGGGDNDIHGALAKAFTYLQLYIMERPNKIYEADAGKEQLEVYDFVSYHHELEPWTRESSDESHAKLPVTWLGSQLFLPVCSRALKTKLKLTNVNASWFCARFKGEFGDEYASPEIGNPVVSMVGIDPCVMQLDMPNLEHIWIPLTSGWVCGDEPRPKWPALKGLDIIVDGKDGYMWDTDRKTRFADITRVIHQPTMGLFRVLFGDGVVRTNMSGLSIRFVDEKEKKELTVPRTEEIVKSCPNLKKIVLTNWVGTNKQLVDLWRGLLELEEIYLYNCKELGNVAFVGGNVGCPVFLGLKSRLKNL